MKQLKLPAVFMRGGTSNAVVFNQKDLPQDRALWDEIFLAAIGSPDPNGRQLDGMGGGDLKLTAALGAWFGPWALLPLLLISSVLHILLALAQGQRSQPLPLGPALVAAAVLYWACSDQAWMRWLSGA
jgi:prepilin signal peptidase PulO-like enzyme (type II secretory pathway)